MNTFNNPPLYQGVYGFDIDTRKGFPVGCFQRANESIKVEGPLWNVQNGDE
jgi:hypothetical protein